MMPPESNPQELRKLLGCKRYEQPPPGYFVSFSDKVIARIEADELPEDSSWWSWLMDRSDAKPVLVCAYGLAVSSLLFMGIRLSQVFDAELAIAPVLSGSGMGLTPASVAINSPESFRTGLAKAAVGSTLASSRPMILDDPNSLPLPWSNSRVQPVGFRAIAR